MPSYIYECQNKENGHGEFEAIHSINDQLTECPQCSVEGQPVIAPKRLISLSSFVLIGGGWASSGYSSK